MSHCGTRLFIRIILNSKLLKIQKSYQRESKIKSKRNELEKERCGRARISAANIVIVFIAVLALFLTPVPKVTSTIPRICYIYPSSYKNHLFFLLGSCFLSPSLLFYSPPVLDTLLLVQLATSDFFGENFSVSITRVVANSIVGSNESYWW